MDLIRLLIWMRNQKSAKLMVTYYKEGFILQLQSGNFLEGVKIDKNFPVHNYSEQIKKLIEQLSYMTEWEKKENADD